MNRYVLYAIVRARDVNGAELTGIDRARVDCVRHRDLGAMVSEMQSDTLDATRANVGAFRDVLVTLSRRGPALPFAFGVAPPSQEVVRELLKLNCAAATGHLRYLADKVQFSVRVVWADFKSVLEEVLRERREIRAQRDELIRTPSAQTCVARIAIGQQVAEAVGKKRRDESERLMGRLRVSALQAAEAATSREEDVAALDLLLRRSGADRFRALVEEMDHAAGERYVFHLRGPEPPLYFAPIPLKVPA
jgi:hypothetical protein